MTNDLKLEVFISWSGKRSEVVATRLKEWLEVTLQFTVPFLSTDIGAGKRWGTELSEALERSNFGILVLTAENLDADWVLFEAGALAKHLGTARVVPLLVDLQPSHLKLPLSDFQAISLNDGILRLAVALNEAQPDPWPKEKVDQKLEWTHDKFLADVCSDLRGIPAQNSTPKRSIEDRLDEILQVMKSNQSPPKRPEETLAPNEQYYPVNDRVSLYKFLKQRADVPLYKHASMPALFDAAARFIRDSDPTLSEEESLTIVAKYLVSERPLQDLLRGLHSYSPHP